jgi:hypothetical protein
MAAGKVFKASASKPSVQMIGAGQVPRKFAKFQSIDLYGGMTLTLGVKIVPDSDRAHRVGWGGGVRMGKRKG